MASSIWFNPAFSCSHGSTYSDSAPIYLTLLCGTKKWRSEKSLVSANSEILAKMFEIRGKDGITDLRLHDEDPNTLTALVTYINWGVYSHALAEDTPWPIYHLRVLSIGVAYKVCGLGTLASEMFYEALKGDFWKTKGFAATIKYLYSTEFEAELLDLTLRTCYREGIVKVASRHLDELSSPNPEYRDFRIVLNANLEFKRRVTEEAGEVTLPLPLKNMDSISPAREVARRRTPTDPQFSAEQVAVRPSTRSLDPPKLQVPAFRPKISGTTSNQVQSKERKRSRSPRQADDTHRLSRRCAICEAYFVTASPAGASGVPVLQCRACADQLEREYWFR